MIPVYRVLALLVALGAYGTVAQAQAQTAPVTGADAASVDASASADAAAPAFEFLPDFNHRFAIEHLSGGGPQFIWDAHWGGELDVARYRTLRFVMVADYEAVLGNQYQPFDPNQGNYTLGGFVAGKVRGLEVAGVMHHVSRHLGDRPKLFGIAWNMYGGRVRYEWIDGPTRVDTRVDLRGVTQNAYVDYAWELDAGVAVRHRLRGSAHLIAAANLRRVGVDGSRGRPDQTGFRAEGGMRFDGRAAALEAFVGVERRIDPDQLRFGTATWGIAGLRLVRR